MYKFLSATAIGAFLAPIAAGQATSNPIDTGIYTAPTSTPSDYTAGGTPYAVIPSTAGEAAPSGTVGANNRFGTRLYGYQGCPEKNYQYYDDINEAYYDSWTIANTPGVLSNINWNEAPALEFLGAPGINKPKQAQIQAVLANIATVIYSLKNPFQHLINVRCDDPLNRCENRPAKDPCAPAPNPGDPITPGNKPLAYARNRGPDKGYPMINFCDGFFARRSLKDAYAYGSGLGSPEKFRLSRYENRAITFFHELLHLDLAADSPTPNPRLTDLTITVKYTSSTRTFNTLAYGPLFTKVLARYGEDVGSYVQKNADNLVYFALAKYIMSKNGNVYPHLPIVVNAIDGPPWQHVNLPPLDMLASFVTDDGKFYLNITDTALNALAVDYPAEAGDGDDYPGCSDDENTEVASPLVIDNMAAPSDYPSDYNSQVSSWISQIVPATGTPTPTTSVPGTSVPAPSKTTTSTHPADATATCSFHVDEWQSCADDASNLFANVTMYDNNKKVIGQTAPSPGTLGEPINTSDPYYFNSTYLVDSLVIVGEHANDYMQFTLGKLNWTSKTTAAPYYCKVGGWNPKDGPSCGIEIQNAENQVDCSFPCSLKVL